MEIGSKFTLINGEVDGYKYRCSHWEQKDRNDSASLLTIGTNTYYCVKEEEYNGEMWTYFDYSKEEGPHLIMMKTNDLEKILKIKKQTYEIY